MWVFAYGSLLWNPGFTPVETRLARVEGYHRSFCMWSIHHRGTEDAPGLVLALDEGGGACEGLALRVSEADEAQVLADLRERELISSAYYEDWLDLLTEAGPVRALCYVVNRDHVQYCGGLPLEKQAEVIAGAHGGRGPNDEYLYSTVSRLTSLGIHDAELMALDARVRALRSQNP